MSEDVRKRASAMFNALSEEDRKTKAGLGYSLAQLNTIRQQRQANKAMIAKEDRRLSEWQNNIERYIEKEYLA